MMFLRHAFVRLADAIKWQADLIECISMNRLSNAFFCFLNDALPLSTKFAAMIPMFVLVLTAL